MQSTPVQIADQYSRKRATLAAIAAFVFIAIHAVMRPLFFDGPFATTETMWAVNAIALLAVLATGGGILNNTQIRLLVNDEVSQQHSRSAIVAGYWVAMTSAMGLYVIPGLAGLTGREAVYVIVTGSVGVALLSFAYLEYRAHLDA